MRNIFFQCGFYFLSLCYCAVAYGSSCAEVTIESAFFESRSVLIVENLSNKLTKSQFVESYISERKHLEGFDKKKYQRKAIDEWNVYKARIPHSDFLVKSNLKGNFNAGNIISLNTTPQISFDIGKSYILFILGDSQEEKSLFIDGCLYFNLTDKSFVKDDIRLSGPKTFEAAIETLMNTYHAALDKANR